MKVYITKYALTRGILKREVNGINLETVVQDALKHGTYYYDGEWYKSWEAAYEKAEDMRQKKIISLQKQIRKLSKLGFKGEG